MKKGYWVVTYHSVSDDAALREYARLADIAVAAGGGRDLVRTADVIAFEAGVKQRTTVVQFDSLEKALATHRSEAYQQALQALGAAVERDFRIAEGTD
jgi:uncharacterized protein (DUF1330 family)